MIPQDRVSFRRVIPLAGIVIVAVVIGVSLWSAVAPSRPSRASASPADGPPEVSVVRTSVGPHAHGLRPSGLQFAVLHVPAHPHVRWLRIPVLMYHRVVAQVPKTANDLTFTVQPPAFDAQMNWLQQHGYHPISETTLFRALALGGVLPKNPIVITFDDGYVDGVNAVLRGLVTPTRRWPATFFVITSRIGKGPFLNWSDLRLLERSGMDIGSHTVFHTPLAPLTPVQRAYELSHSERTLARGLGHPVYWFAYPYGSVNPAAAQAVAAAGYLLAYGTQPNWWLSFDNRTVLPRMNVAGTESLSQFAAAVTVASHG